MTRLLASLGLSASSFSCPLGPSPLLACVLQNLGAGGTLTSWDPPQYIFSHLRRANPGFSSLLTHYLRDLHLQVEPQLPASAQVLAPCLQDTVQHPAPPPPPAGPQPRPAPAARPLRSGGWRGGRAGSCAVCKAGRSRLGGGAAPKSTNHRCDHIHANTSTMERAHHSLLQASLKRASV